MNSNKNTFRQVLTEINTAGRTYIKIDIARIKCKTNLSDTNSDG